MTKTNHMEHELDAQLRRMASDIRAVGPKPSGDLITRILADAANVAEQATVEAPIPARVPAHLRFSRAIKFLLRFAWPHGAIAGMATGLIAGFAVGYGYSDDRLTFSDPEDALAMAIFTGNLDNIEEYIQ